MNSRYYRTRIKYLDAIKLLPDPHPLHNLPSKTRTASVLRRKINPVELEVCSKANTKKSVPKLTTARHFSGDRASMIESYNPKSWRAVRFPMLDCGSRDINADNPQSKQLKRLIEPKVLRCPYSADNNGRRAFSAGVKRTPLEYTFGPTNFQQV